MTQYVVRLAIAFSALLMIVGCNQQYRYPCQNPANWKTAKCQKPICEVHRECPDMIFKEGRSSHTN